MAACLSSVTNENTVEYYLFPQVFDSNEDSKRVKSILDDCINQYTAQISEYLFSYIWQNEQFRMTSVVTSDVPESFSIPPHLYGCTNFGDNVEDEWFVVFLLVQLTKAFPSLVVRVVDGDGEFLLIEAADYLKKWMNPESCEKRVYLHQGDVHIIPHKKNLGVSVGVPSFLETTRAVRGFRSSTKACPKIQQAIDKRLSRFPNSIRENLHRAHCYLPAAAAVILQAQPSLISAVVETFYHRDPLDLKACSAMKYFPPETRVLTEVMFTKCLYAQITQQEFIPDKKVGWSYSSENTAQIKEYELGIKLACGLEILAARSSKRGVCNKETNFDSDVRWHRYVQSLTGKGFFKDYLEHSKPYCELLEKAKLYYLENIHQESDQTKQLPGDKILLLLNSLDIDIDQLKKKEKYLNPADDDSWLTVTADQLDGILAEKFTSSAKNSAAHDDDDDLATKLPSTLKDFVGHISSHEGAEFPKLRNKQSNLNKSNRVTFDPDSFADVMQSILDFKLPDSDADDHSSSSGMSDYSEEDFEEPDLTEPNQKSCDANHFANEMKSYMDQMDRELSKTSIGQSFEKDDNVKVDVDEDDDDYKPVNVDLTALKNILESYNSQQGLPGPATNLFGSMGISLPDDDDDDDLNA